MADVEGKPAGFVILGFPEERSHRISVVAWRLGAASDPDGITSLCLFVCLLVGNVGRLHPDQCCQVTMQLARKRQRPMLISDGQTSVCVFTCLFRGKKGAKRKRKEEYQVKQVAQFVD